MANFELIAIFTALLIVSSVPALVVLWRVRTHHGDTLLISKRRLLVATLITIPIGWLSSAVPGPVFPLFLAIVLSLVLKPNALDVGDVGEESVAVLDNLKRIQEDFSAAELHLQGLSTRIQVSQRDIAAKENKRVALQKEIEKQLHDAEEWQRLSQGQKELFVQAAREAIRRRSFMESAALVCGGLALNLIASLLWALMGAPGKQELLGLLSRLHS